MTRKIAIGAILSMAVTSAAFAQGFVAVGAGSANASADCSGFDTCKDSSTGYKLSGGYMFTDQIGIEAVYLNMGKVTASGTIFYPGYGSYKTDIEIKTTGYGVGILGLVPVGTDWVFNYRLGLLNAKSKFDVTAISFVSGSESKSSTTVYFGIGGGYNVNSNVTVALEYDRFNAKDIADESYTVSLLSLAARYKF